MKIFNYLLLILSFNFLLISCSSTPAPGTSEAEVLYNEIKSNYDGKRYLMALEKISTFRTKYPYSFYISEIELLRADIYFDQQNYLEAVDAYLTFKDFHPKHKNLDRVEWRIAESFFHQMPETVDRDLSAAQSGINSYQNLILKYPSSEYREKAKSRIEAMEKLLEDKEAYIANFYFRTNDFQSASYRYEKIMNFVKNEEILKYSAKNLVECYVNLKKADKCLDGILNFRKYFEQNTINQLMKKCESIKG